GNPWFICTMWLAEYEIARTHSPEGLKEAAVILEWVADHALPSGVLAEQVHPYSGEPLSVSPLTWSHATFVTCVLEYLEKRRQVMAEVVLGHTITPF
ncbi:MAG: glycoside hydrolase family 15 protein, partial [Leptolyngbya sp.]|nr:glycoside hydrolase family 15 protein [Candidatus Melainabacteria bacterium]